MITLAHPVVPCARMSTRLRDADSLIDAGLPLDHCSSPAMAGSGVDYERDIDVSSACEYREMEGREREAIREDFRRWRDGE